MNRLERQIAVALIAFPLTVLLSKFGQTQLQAAWPGLLPLLPAVALGALGFEYMRRRDELQRRILLEAAGFAVAVTFAVTLAWLLLQKQFTLSSPAAMTFVAVLAASWFLGLALAWRRYCAE